jgi:hypothetical protein
MINIECHGFDYKDFAGLMLENAVQILLSKNSEIYMEEYNKFWTLATKKKGISYKYLAAITLDHWYVYNAYEDQGNCHLSLNGDNISYFRDEYELIDWCVHNINYWTYAACGLLSRVLRPLSDLLEQGLLTAEGQKEPVISLRQPYEPIPYHIFDNRCWRLMSEKSCLEVLSKRGEVEAVFKRVRLTLPSDLVQPKLVYSSRKDSFRDQAIKALTVEDAKQLLIQNWNLQSIGSQRVAREFTDRYPDCGLSLRAVRRMADECRGGSNPRGRPIGR